MFIFIWLAFKAFAYQESARATGSLLNQALTKISPESFCLLVRLQFSTLHPPPVQTKSFFDEKVFVVIHWNVRKWRIVLKRRRLTFLKVSAICTARSFLDFYFLCIIQCVRVQLCTRLMLFEFVQEMLTFLFFGTVSFEIGVKWKALMNVAPQFIKIRRFPASIIYLSFSHLFASAVCFCFV